MISTRPYLIRAMHEWIVDNGWTPYILVDANAEGTSVPAGYSKDGEIVLNLSYTATKNLSLGNEEIGFNGRFNGVPTIVSIPINAVLAIYAKENGAGMAFQEEPPSVAQGQEELSEEERKESVEEGGDKESSSEPPTPGKPSRPVLRIVK
uniref:Stringent starvation protein B n=1 Tax=Candidatus Kentrum sp. FW TaxID=2126338 RepID=A0A450S113_9GAMM|nr:MAG: stringent starvation protein B [Candidatus Kentron sp. FW]VFJ62106.1 MAG: stringent starvation protein B [Candidatus Kentron sp. FW]